MPSITFPTDTKETIDEIRNTIGRKITVMVPSSGVPCTVCDLDPTTGLSTDPFCSGCDGEYWVTTLSGWKVQAHVRWDDLDQPLKTPGGVINEGDCKVTITTSGGTYLDRIKRAEYFLVDDVDLYMINYALKGVREPNRIAITLKEDAN